MGSQKVEATKTFTFTPECENDEEYTFNSKKSPSQRKQSIETIPEKAQALELLYKTLNQR